MEYFEDRYMATHQSGKFQRTCPKYSWCNKTSTARPSATPTKYPKYIPKYIAVRGCMHVATTHDQVTANTNMHWPLASKEQQSTRVPKSCEILMDVCLRKDVKVG